MKVKVNWDTDGFSVEELGLQEVVDMPTLDINDIADYLSDEYGYCVKSFEIIKLNRYIYNEENAWLITDYGNEMIVLVGDYTLEYAIDIKNRVDNEEDVEDVLVWIDREELSLPCSINH
jgi:hypothetical protein